MSQLKGIFILFTVVTLLAFKSQENCQEQFNGKWKYEQFHEEFLYVERTSEKQFEFTENGAYYYEFDIEWKTACSYDLTYLGTTSPIPAKAEIGEKLHVEIVLINDSVMVYKTTFGGLEEAGKMIRMKE